MTLLETLICICFAELTMIGIFALAIRDLAKDIVRLRATIEEDGKYISKLEKRAINQSCFKERSVCTYEDKAGSCVLVSGHEDAHLTAPVNFCSEPGCKSEVPPPRKWCMKHRDRKG